MPPSANGDEQVAAMDKLGIDGAIFISAFSIYGYDSSYAVEVQKKHPGRFAIVKPIDPDDPDPVATAHAVASRHGVEVIGAVPERHLRCVLDTRGMVSVETADFDAPIIAGGVMVPDRPGLGLTVHHDRLGDPVEIWGS